MSTLVTIIIPVYNAGQYMTPCLDSVLAQTFSNFEVWLINDGSTDSSGDICDAYSRKDSRVQVIHKANEGVSKARNIGIALASGRYIMYVDADDMVKPSMVQELLDAIEHNDVDLVLCKIYRFSDAYGEEPCKSSKNVFLDKKETLNFMLNRIAIKDPSISPADIFCYGFTCGIYKKEILEGNSILFPNFKIGEDTFYLNEYLINCKSINLLESSLYGYRRNENSTMSSLIRNFYEDAQVSHICYSQLLNKYNLSDNLSYVERIDMRYANKLFDCAMMLVHNAHTEQFSSFEQFQIYITPLLLEIKAYKKHLSFRKKLHMLFVTAISKHWLPYRLFLKISCGK